MADVSVVHLVPYDGIGGVETAARSMGEARQPGIDFRVAYVFPGARPAGAAWLRAMLQYPARAASLARRAPDVLVVSLWRSCIVGILVKLMRPSTRLVLMLHYPWNVHLVDKLVTGAAAALAQEIWTDSHRTRQERRCGAPFKRRRVISFVAHRLPAARFPGLAPRFIFWGRLSPQKGLDRALHLFGEIRQLHPGATFRIIGPDGGALTMLQHQVRLRDLTESVSFAGPLDLQAIVREAGQACFYLQCSVQEGMGMSVVEAMQLGLVPVVTPAGEIGSYCMDGVNAVLVDSGPDAAQAVDRLLAAPAEYSRLRDAAIQTWRGRPLYAESMLQAVMDMLQTKGATGEEQAGRPPL